MTGPTEPSVEASEGGFRFSSPMDWGCECGGQGNCKPCADMLARNRTCACPNPGFRHATELHDWHERAVRQARAEGAAEALREAADAFPHRDLRLPIYGTDPDVAGGLRRLIRNERVTDWLLARAAQPEDARGGEGLG